MIKIVAWVGRVKNFESLFGHFRPEITSEFLWWRISLYSIQSLLILNFSKPVDDNSTLTYWKRKIYLARKCSYCKRIYGTQRYIQRLQKVKIQIKNNMTRDVFKYVSTYGISQLSTNSCLTWIVLPCLTFFFHCQTHKNTFPFQ